jgi:hypothetical protein
MNKLQEDFKKAWEELNTARKEDVELNHHQYNEKKNKICLTYVLQNSGVKVGDIIEDRHFSKIKVEKIFAIFGAFDSYPSGRFMGKFIDSHGNETKIPGVIYECDLINK